MQEKIGKYDIKEKIGTGGFGVVYKAWDPLIKRTVAIKTCEVDDDEIKERFFREAELVGNLHHPNITIVYDFGIEDEVPYLVQEFLSGEDLDKFIKRGDLLTLRNKLEILMNVARGLTHAHEHSIVHRDIKPSNIRITESGNVKIMDFGIAKSSQMASQLTQTGITLGTAAYLSPEQIKGSTTDPRTDIFSFGVMMYELFTGIKPFSGDNISQIIYQVINVDPVHPSKVLPDFPKELEEIILKCLCKNPDGRYSTMLNVIRAIDKALLEFTSLDLDDMVIQTTSHRPTTPISATLDDLRPTIETPSSGYDKQTSRGKVLYMAGGATIILLMIAGFIYFSGIRPASGPAPDNPGIEVPNPLQANLPDDTLTGTLEPPPPLEEGEKKPVEKQKKEPAQLPETKPAAAGRGKLIITSNRATSILIDGEMKGSFPPRLELELKPGKHKIEWQGSMGSHTQTVTLESNSTFNAHHSFPAVAYGRLSVRTPIGSPWGILYIDGKKIGPTPQSGLELPVGTHRAEVRREGYKTLTRDIEILEGRILDWPVKLYPQ